MRPNEPINVPIHQTTIFAHDTSEELGRSFRERLDSVYLRFGNPTLSAVASELALLEGTDAAILFDSGMGAITTCLLTFARAGRKIIAQRNIFAQTFTFLDTLCRELGIETEFVDSGEVTEFAAAVDDRTCLIYIETPSNPQLSIVDIAAVARVADAARVPLLVDNTFASSVLQQPVKLGATLSIQSGTKYLSGHSDLMCGVAAGSEAVIRGVYDTRFLMGGVLDPHAAWLLSRSLKTLDLRVERQSANALAIARYLEQHPLVTSVSYPFLSGHPSYEVARRQMRGGGGVVTFEVEGGLERARRVLAGFSVIRIATSLGGVVSVAEIPCELDFSAEEGGATAPGGMIRLAVGTEDEGVLLGDLERALV